MEEMLKDKRFAHIASDPKFKRIPKNERKIKIDKRFKSMFENKNFAIKYTVDKRGRPINQTSAENLRKYYEISSSEEDSSTEESDSTSQKNEQFKKQKLKKEGKFEDSVLSDKSSKDENYESEDSDQENFSSNGSLLLIKQPLKSDSNEESVGESDKESIDKNEILENEKQLEIRSKSNKNLDNDVKKKLRDLTVDYARGEGVLFSDSSSDEESSYYEDDEEEIEHNWGELDKEAESTNEITNRLAACNMDWDRIRAVDLMVLFNSFLPTGGLIHSITIYPSDFGLQRMKEEEIKGPIELVESKTNTDDEDDDKNSHDENEEGSSYHMEKLRQYQLNRLKYYYAVIVFDSANTANKVYTECDGLEYESSATKLDLRFIPDEMIFEQEPKEVCDKLPDLSKYQPRLFTTTALQQVKVDLTWDETNPERQEISQKLNSGKLDDIDKNDIQAYLASGTSEDESEDEIKKQLDKIDENGDENPIDKYKSLLKSIEQAEEEKKNKEVELEFTWGLDVKEKTEKLIKEKMKQNENLTPFEKYLEKRKEKKKAKREQKKNMKNDKDKYESDSEDSIPSDIDMNDPYFAEELKSMKSKSKKRKNISNDSDQDSVDEEKQKRRQAELELLLMDENDESNNKRHFNMKRIEEAESLTKSKKKRLTKKKKELKEEASKDDFQINVEDQRFSALFTSHHYNIDPADSHYRKTKGTEALIKEKLKRRNENNTEISNKPKLINEHQDHTNSKDKAELNTLIKSIKRNTQNLNKHIK